jgi:hypothetical protein
MVWYRRIHRWLGITALLFLLLLSTTGIALNHVSDWRLDERYVGWTWLLHAYGIEVPPMSASFADDGHRATLIGRRLYLDGGELGRDVDSLAGIAVVPEAMVIATADDIYLLKENGDLIERLRVHETVMGPVESVGVEDNRVILKSGDDLFRFDESLLNLEPWNATPEDSRRWSTLSAVPAGELEELERLYRGRGITVARLLADLHGGRIVARIGPLLMDAAAVALIVLCLTGLYTWLPKGPNSRNGSKNTSRNGRKNQ